MPYYRYRNEDREIYIAAASEPEDAVWALLIMVVAVPLGILLACFSFFSEFVTRHFILTSIIYQIVAAIACILLIRFKNVTRLRVLDFAGNFLMFFVFYLFTYFYYVPMFFIKTSVFSWIIGSGIIIAVIFLQQCFRRIIKNSVINFIICFVLFAVFYAIFRISIINRSISLDFLCEIYGIVEGGIVKRLLELII